MLAREDKLIRTPAAVAMPQAPVLVAGFREVVWVSAEGEIEALAPAEAIRRVQIDPPILCHAVATARRLDTPVFSALDLLELFAFVYPARFCVPTPRGLAEALGLPLPGAPSEACATLAAATRALLEALGQENDAEIRAVAAAMDAWRLVMGPGGYGCTSSSRNGLVPASGRFAGMDKACRMDRHSPSTLTPRNAPVLPEEARARLARLLGDKAEPRPQQADYAAAVAAAFAPREIPDSPHAVLAEAGTGVGKTWDMSRRPASGRKRTAARYGFRPLPAICRPRSRPSSIGSIPIRK